ncbi:MAG: glycoside hydrolase family 16 protein [Bacteroidales bacterium]
MMRKSSHILFFILSIFLILHLIIGCYKPEEQEYPDRPGTGDYELVWSDEFEYSGLPDSYKWSFDTDGNATGWGNQEEQYYTSERIENAQVSDGVLKITARREDYEGFKYTSARLRTAEKGDWLYGRVEVKAKLPDGRGMWPAIWMLPTDWVYGGWPESGEIDIMENVGYDPWVIVASAHTESYNHMIGTNKSGTITVEDCYTDFHVYALEWEQDEFRVYVDDNLYFTFKNEGEGYKVWPFNQRFHLLINIAVGGTWGGAQGIDEEAFPSVMEVDYVHVYQLR